jgi:putative endonuclease
MGAAVSAGAFLYILRCADGSYYVGTSRNDLEIRVAEHNAGIFGGYTAKRRPVSLFFAQHFESIRDVIAAERQVKGWSRSKKEALARGDWESISMLAQRRRSHPSRRAASPRSSG